MVAAVREGKLIAMEGDYDHIVNRGSLCVKGISMFATHASPNRLHDAALPGAGQRPLGGHLLGRRDRAGRAEDSEDARRDLDRHREGRRQGGSGQSDGRDRLPGRRAEHERGVLPLPEGGPAARPGLRRAPGPTLTQPHGPRSGGLVREGGDDQPLDRPAELQDDPGGRQQRGREPPHGLQVDSEGTGERGEDHPRRSAIHPDLRGGGRVRAHPARAPTRRSRTR